MLIQRRLSTLYVCLGLWVFICFLPKQVLASSVEARSKSLAHYLMATIHELNGDARKAFIELQQSSRFDRKQPLPHLRLGASYIRQGKLERAIKELMLVVKLDPASIQAHYLLAFVYSSQKKYELATNQYELILTVASTNNPANLEVHHYLAELYYALHQFPKAMDQIAEVLKHQPKSTSALFLWGAIEMDSHHDDKAIGIFRQILSEDPDHDESLNCLAYIYAQHEDHLDDALRMVRKAINLDPSNGAFYDTLGWVLFKKGFYTESLLALEKAKGLVEDPIVYEHIGDVYQAVNEGALARKFWMKSLALDPKQVSLAQKLQQQSKVTAKQQTQGVSVK